MPIRIKISKILYVVYSIIVLSVLFTTPTHAESLDYTVNISPSLNVTIPTNTLSLKLNPNNKTFDYQDIDITVSTNNITGYYMNMSTANNNTNLIHTLDSNNVIETLPNATSESNFPVNKWGYRIVSTDGITSNNGIITGSDYLPFVSGVKIAETTETSNSSVTNLRFGAKIDYTKIAGTYATTLDFNATAHFSYPYMQDFTEAMCRELASDSDTIVQDKRDFKDYTVRYINGNCWMTQNLRFGEDDTNPDTTILTLTPEDSDVTEARTLTVYDMATHWGTDGQCYGDFYNAVGLGYTTPCMHSKDTINDNIGVWYNYATASAGTIAGEGDSTDVTEAAESICPSGWGLPSLEQARSIGDGTNTYSESFKPVIGGDYNGQATNIDYGYWWTSTASDDGRSRYSLVKTPKPSFEIYYLFRVRGRYIRCVAQA